MTGKIWGWPTEVDFLVATPVRHLRGFLLSALGNQSSGGSRGPAWPTRLLQRSINLVAKVILGFPAVSSMS